MTAWLTSQQNLSLLLGNNARAHYHMGCLERRTNSPSIATANSSTDYLRRDFLRLDDSVQRLDVLRGYRPEHRRAKSILVSQLVGLEWSSGSLRHWYGKGLVGSYYYGGGTGIHHSCGHGNCEREESFEAELRDAENIGWYAGINWVIGANTRVWRGPWSASRMTYASFVNGFLIEVISRFRLPRRSVGK